MDSLLHDLSGLLLKAVPTIILLIFVHFFLKAMLFRPLQDVLKRRHAATEGAQEAAKKSLELVAEKSSQYELAFKQARSEMYREQEETRRKWLEESAVRIEETRQKARTQVQDAGHKLAADVEEARKDLASRSQALAMQIVESLVAAR